MEFLSNFQATAATPAIMSMVYLLLIFWVRRPERRDAGLDATGT